MAGATVQVRSGQFSSGSGTISITTTAGNLLAVVSGGFAANPAQPTRTGQSWNVAISPFQDGGTDSLRADYAMNIAGNSNGVAVSCSGGVAADVYELSGIATTSALGAVNHGISTTFTAQPGSITPTAGSVVITGTNDDGSGSSAATISSGYTVDEAGGAGTVWDESGPISGSAHADNVAATATNPTWTSAHSGPTHMTALIMEFLAAAGGGGGGSVVAPLLMLMGIGS